MKTVILILGLFLLSQNKSHAFLIEPFLGYSTGSMDISGESLLPYAFVSDTYKMAGSAFGIRLAFEPGNFQLGGEYFSGKYKMTEGELVTQESKFNTSELGLFLGYRFWYMRLYSSFLIVTDRDSSLAGQALKAGLSFYPLTHLALNIEVTKASLDGIEEGVMMDANYTVTTFLVSFPFSL